MRSNRETEPIERYPIRMVCDWIDNRPDITKEHCVRMRERHFERASKSGEERGAVDGKSVQNPVQHPAAASRMASQETHKPSGLRAIMAVFPEGLAENQYPLGELSQLLESLFPETTYELA